MIGQRKLPPQYGIICPESFSGNVGIKKHMSVMTHITLVVILNLRKMS